MTDGSGSEKDRRGYPRIPLRVEVILETRASSVGYAINVSETGMCLQSPRPYRVGQRMQLRLGLSADDPWIELQAEVVWCAPEYERVPGMTYRELGLRFLDVGRHELSLLRELAESGG